MRKTIFIAMILSLPALMLCQATDNSPYSRFGMGDIADRNFMSSQFMGGLGSSYSDPYQINIVNPAALSHLVATSFEMGLSAKSKGLRNGVADGQTPNAYQSLWSGNLNYISLAMPLQNRVNDLLERKKRAYSVTTAFTLMPYSTVGYNITTTESLENIGDVSKNFEGEGGSYQFLWSNAIKYKDFSFGVNLGYLFGNVEYARSVQFEPSEPYFNTLFTETNRYSGFLWDAGFIYTLKLNKSVKEGDDNNRVLKTLNFGIHAGTNTSFTTRSSSFEGAVQSGTGIVDTLSSSEEMSFDGTLPSTMGLGVSYYHGEKYALGINYSRANWSKFDAHFVNNSLNNTSNLSFGGYFRPDYKSISNYFSRVYYRFGLFYNQVPNAIPDGLDNTIEDVGFSVGMGMPLFYQRKISHANLGLTVGRRGRGSAVEERYIRISFSFTFNDDEWFIKRKYN